MKPIVLAGFVVLASVSGMANANCTTDPRIMATGRTNLTTTFSNKLVCGRPGANYPGQGGASSPDRWQEQHNTSGRLVDFKKGPTDPVDPSETVGSWSIDPTNSTIVHKYKGGATYAWEVRLAAGGKYSFCVGGAEHVVAFIPPGVGASGCGGRFP